MFVLVKRKYGSDDKDIMISYDKAKLIFNNLFESIEVGIINFLVKKLYYYRLRYKYTLKTDSITPEFKKQVKQYWYQYTKKFKWHWHRYYSSRNGIYDVRYIPDDLYYTVIDQHFNNRKFGWGVNDKNYYQIWFPEVKQPETVVRRINGIFYDESYRIISLNKAIDLCLNNKSLVIKPSVDTGGGKGIIFWERTDGVRELEMYLTSRENIIVQQKIIQHPDLHKIHPDSVNTIRTISLLFKGEVHILSSVLRMGINGKKVDNASAGGITCGIKYNGKLKNVAYSANGIIFERHPQGFDFSNFRVPSFEKVLKIIEQEHEKMAHFRLISWDFAIIRMVHQY